MAKRRRKLTVGGVFAAFLGFVCAVMLALLFYGAMVYQLAGEDATGAPGIEGAGGVLSLTSGTLLEETTTQQAVGGADCAVTTRVYALESGEQVRAITASPAAYIERLSAQGVTMELITGFVIDGLDAVYARQGETGLLAARSGDTVYVIEGPQDQQALYELGAMARREQAE